MLWRLLSPEVQVALGLKFLLDPYAHESFHLCAAGNLLFALTQAGYRILGEMATNSSFDSLKSAGAPIAAGVGQSIVTSVAFRVVNDKFSKMNWAICDSTGKRVGQGGPGRRGLK